MSKPNGDTKVQPTRKAMAESNSPAAPAAQDAIPRAVVPAVVPAAVPVAVPAEQTVAFVITGFGAFQGIEHNPSEQLVHALLHADTQQPRPLHAHAVVVSGTVLEVSRAGVNDVFPRLCHHHSKSQQPPQPRPSQCVYLHFGVHGRAATPLLETSAYNDATFRCPDQRGDTPQRERIRPHSAFGHALHSDCDTAQLCAVLQQTHGHAVALSSDPGRFLCNYVYYQSLCRAATEQAHSLFVHVPPHATVSAAQQLRFAIDLINAITHQLLEWHAPAAASASTATAGTATVGTAAAAGSAATSAAIANATAATTLAPAGAAAASAGAGVGSGSAAVPVAAVAAAGDVWAKSM